MIIMQAQKNTIQLNDVLLVLVNIAIRNVTNKQIKL